MTPELIARALGVPCPREREVSPGGQLVVLFVKPSRWLPIALWYETSGGDFGADLGAAAMDAGDLLAATGALARGLAPPPAPSAKRERAHLSRRQSYDVDRALEQAGLYSLASLPLEGTDGMTLHAEARSGRRGWHRFEAWAPGPRHRAVLRALCEPAALRFRGTEWVTSTVDEALRQAARSDADEAPDEPDARPNAPAAGGAAASVAPAPTAAIDREGLCLRFRLGHAGGDAGAPTVLVYAGGRVEHWRAADGAWDGVRLSRREAGADAVARALPLARRVVAMTPPRPHGGHDPTRALTLEVYGEGGAQSRAFAWGRASRNDAPLAPVEGGEGATATFDALLAALGPFEVR